MNLNTRKRRIEAGLCVKCGGILDTDKRVCTKCRKILAEECKAMRQWYSQSGICPYCRKEKLFGNEKSCPECRAKSAINSEKQRRKDREKYNKICSNAHRKSYSNRKENGLCVRCGKRKADSGVLCSMCYAKKNNYLREVRSKKNDGIPRVERVSFGLCYICGSKLDRDGGLCLKCAETVTNNLPEDRGGGIHWNNADYAMYKNIKERGNIRHENGEVFNISHEAGT